MPTIDVWERDYSGDEGVFICPACEGELRFACEYQAAEYDINVYPGCICGPHVDPPANPCQCNHPPELIDSLATLLGALLMEPCADEPWGDWP